MLNTTLPFLSILALGYAALMTFGEVQTAFDASLYQVLSCSSGSACFSQYSLSIFLAITRIDLSII